MQRMLLIVLMLLPAAAPAGPEKDGHRHKPQDPIPVVKAGPNGGRMVRGLLPPMEVWLRPDGYLQLAVVTPEGTVGSVEQQSASLTGGSRLNPFRMRFVAQEGLLVSEKPVPAENSPPIVLQIRVTPDADTVFEKFYLNLAGCGGCAYREYACTCGH